MISEKAVWIAKYSLPFEFPCDWRNFKFAHLSRGYRYHEVTIPAQLRHFSTYQKRKKTITHAKWCLQKWFESTNTASRLSFPGDWWNVEFAHKVGFTAHHQVTIPWPARLGHFSTSQKWKETIRYPKWCWQKWFGSTNTASGLSFPVTIISSKQNVNFHTAFECKTCKPYENIWFAILFCETVQL